MAITKAKNGMSADEKALEARRLLPLVKPLLPKQGEFAIWEVSGKLNLENTDRQVLLLVQEQITGLLIQSELYKYSRVGESNYHIERIVVDEFSEKKHLILQYLIDHPGWRFANEIITELKLDFNTIHFLLSEMESEHSVNLKDASTKQGPDFYVEISEIGKGRYIREDYLKLSNKTSAAMNYNDNSVNITGDGNVFAPGNKGEINSKTTLKNQEDAEMKRLAEQSVKWTKKQTLWTIAGVIIATILTILGMYFTGNL